MKKQYTIGLVIVIVLVSLLVNITIGDYLAARLSVLPVVKKFNLLNPRAPIVINNRETVMVSDANDAVETVADVKSKLATLIYYKDGTPVVAGNLLSWTADGYFIGAGSSYTATGKTYGVVTANGDVLPVKNVSVDPASGLLIIATDGKSLATVDTEEDSSLRTGQKLLFIANSLTTGKSVFLESYVRALSHDVAGVVFDSNKIVRGVFAQQVGPLLPGYAITNLEGKIVGIWDGDSVISSDAIRSLANNFFNDGMIVQRPNFGFKYRQLSKIEAKINQTTAGALVTSVSSGQPAQLAGLRNGDIIIAVSGKRVDDNTLLESLLDGIKPGERTILEVTRQGANQTIVITTGYIK